jgi:hypothetical protein
MKNNKSETSKPLKERRNFPVNNIHIPTVTKNIKIVNWNKIKKALEKKNSKILERSQLGHQNKLVTLQ